MESHELKQAVGKCVAVLSSAFRIEVDATLLEAYRLGLSGLSTEQISRATAAALTTCKFMPVPAELRELAGADGASFESLAERAFLVLTKAMQSLGPDCSVNFTDGAINATLRLHGGWIRVCELPSEEFDKWFRKDFVKTYVGLCKAGASPDLCRYHGGHLERDNASWDGRTMPGGGTYRLGMYGSDVTAVGVDYKPALPAPEPRRAITHSAADYGLTIQRLPAGSAP